MNRDDFDSKTMVFFTVIFVLAAGLFAQKNLGCLAGACIAAAAIFSGIFLWINGAFDA